MSVFSPKFSLFLLPFPGISVIMCFAALLTTWSNHFCCVWKRQWHTSCVPFSFFLPICSFPVWSWLGDAHRLYLSIIPHRLPFTILMTTRCLGMFMSDTDKGWTRSPGCVPPSPPMPDHRHSLAATHLEHGAISPLSTSPHQRRREISDMASVRPRATHATGCTRSTSDRLLFRRHRSRHVQRATTNDSANRVECRPSTCRTYSTSSRWNRRASPTQPRTMATTGAGH